VHDDIQSKGATLVAITPQLPQHSQKLIDKHGLAFPLLRDPENAYAAELGLRVVLPDDLKSVYRELGLDLEAANGTSDWTLPMPARIVVKPDGEVYRVDADPDYTKRPEPSKTLDDLDPLT